MTAEEKKPAPEGRRRKFIIGMVVSNKMEKTITVKVERLVCHPKFGKIMRRYTTYVCHDEKREARPGDKVVIASTRPMSKSKRWTLKEILDRGREGVSAAAAPAAGTPTE